MTNFLTVDGMRFQCHGISGRVQHWDNLAGVITEPCHDPNFFVIDDHTFFNGQGARRPAPASGLTDAGLAYQQPIDCRSLFFDDGSSRVYGIDGASVDLVDVHIPAGHHLDFSWKFLAADGEATGADDFLMMLAYDGAAPVPEAAPTIDKIKDGATQPGVDLLQGATIIHDPSMPPRLAEGRDPRTNSINSALWIRGPSWNPGGDFKGTVRWITCNGWRLHGGDRPSTSNRNSLRRQRAFPSSCLLDCIHVV